MAAQERKKENTGHPVQIIDIEMFKNQPSRMNLTSNLKHIIKECGDKHVALYSIAGPSRQGKSFLLSFMIKYLTALEKKSTGNWLGETNNSDPLEGFPFQNGIERQTTGLWLWSRPFMIKNSKGEEIAVFVMDTQGVFDNHTTIREWSAIVGLSLLTSSCLIYNVVQNLQEDVLNMLESFMQYGILAMKEDESGDKCFQKLSFLIRDWNIPDDCDYGPLGGEKFLDAKFKLHEHLPETAKNVRQTMKKCFQELECFLMPDPGDAAKSNDFKGCLKDLDPLFVECISSFMDNLLGPEQMQVKKIGGQLLKGKNLYQLFQRYVNLFNSEDMPSTMSLLDATSHSVCETMVEKIKDDFIQQFQEHLLINGFLNDHNFNEANEMLTKEAILQFDKKRIFGDAKIAKKHRGRLVAELAKLSCNLKDVNERKKSEKNDTIREKLLSEFKTKMHAIVENNYILHEDLDKIISEEVPKMLEEFCKAFDNNKTFLDDLVPPFHSKIQEIISTLNTKNEEKINAARTVARSLVENSFATYENEMNYKLLHAPNTILNDEFILAVENILRKQTIASFETNFKIPSQQLAIHHKNELELLMNAKVEDIAKNNSGKRKEQIFRVEALIENITGFYEADFSNALELESAPDKGFMNSQHFNLQQKYNDIFLNQAGISDLNVLAPFIQKLKLGLNNSLENLKVKLDEKQNKIMRETADQINQIKDEYNTDMMDVLKRDKICNQQELVNAHKIQVQLCEEKLQLPEFLNAKDKQDFRNRLLEQLTNEFKNLNTSYNNKLHESYSAINEFISEAMSQYNAQMSQSMDEFLESGDLDNKHKDVACSLHDALSLKAEHLPDELCLQSKQQLEKLLDTEYANFYDKFTLRQEEMQFQGDHFYNECISIYKEKIDKKLKEITDELLITQWHDLLKNQLVEHFKQNVKPLKFDSTNMTNELSIEISKIFDDQLLMKADSLQVLEDMANNLMKNYLETYKQNMDQLLISDSSENESEFAQREKEIRDNTSSQFHLACGDNIPITNFNKKKEIFMVKIEAECQSYLGFFRQRKNNEQEAKQIIIPKALDDYIKAMENIFETSADINLPKLKEVHDRLVKSTVENIPAHANKSIVDDLRQQMEGFYINYKNRVENQQAVNDKTSKIITQWKNQIDSKIESHFQSSSDLSEINSIKNSLINQWNTEIHFDEKTKHIVNNELMTHLEKAVSRAQEDFLKAAPVASAMKLAETTAIITYENQMNKHLGNADFVHPIVLDDFHQKASDAALQKIRNDKILQITPNVTKQLTSVFKKSFVQFRDKNHKNTPVKPAIGIDLGTTFSCVAVYNAGKVKIIPNENAKNTTPSYVSFDRNGHEAVGESAKNQAHLNPENTIFDAKRLIGRRFDDPIVQADIKQWPFQVVDSNGSPKIQVNQKTYWPEEISAKILKQMKLTAENYLGCTVENAVITVPAYFNDGQKQATIDAGKFAGLNVLGILNEPTAAAVAYSLHYSCEDKRNVLVFDFGGGTFDVAALSIHDGEIVAKAVDGDTHLGGEDFDSKMMAYCLEQFQSTTNIVDLLSYQSSADMRLRNDANRRLKRLRGECERQKINLSGCLSTKVTVEAFYEQQDLTVEMTRETFETINAELLDRSLMIVERVLQQANIDKNDINDVVLVGGSTKIPKVRTLLKAFFDGKALNSTINPDEAVACGAAIHAAILNGEEAIKLNKIKLTDVTPLSIGVEMVGGVFSPIIKKNTPIPTKMTETYKTTLNNQSSAQIKIYEGEGTVANKNHLLGKFELNGIPEGVAGSQNIVVHMHIDTNGILNVEAVCKGANISKTLSITPRKGRLFDDQINGLTTAQKICTQFF